MKDRGGLCSPSHALDGDQEDDDHIACYRDCGRVGERAHVAEGGDGENDEEGTQQDDEVAVHQDAPESHGPKNRGDGIADDVKVRNHGAKRKDKHEAGDKIIPGFAKGHLAHRLVVLAAHLVRCRDEQTNRKVGNDTAEDEQNDAQAKTSLLHRKWEADDAGADDGVDEIEAGSRDGAGPACSARAKRTLHEHTPRYGMNHRPGSPPLEPPRC